MKLASVDLLRLTLPLVSPFRTSFGVQTARDVLLVVARTTDGVTGYGECVALADPADNEEHVEGAASVLSTSLVPAVLAADDLTAARVAGLTRFVVGHRMAKAALELAVLDAQLRTAGTSLTDHLGGVRDRADVRVFDDDALGLHVELANRCRTPVWCGGMLETGLGRAANLALAALPGFVLPGDISASARYFAEDITEPFVLEDGQIAVPRGPGLGVTVREDVVAGALTARESFRR